VNNRLGRIQSAPIEAAGREAGVVELDRVGVVACLAGDLAEDQIIALQCCKTSAGLRFV
jgi:hypothetical protein